MKIRLISQASLLVETQGVRILSDPWYSDRVYSDAWELCPPPRRLPELGSLDALYISHAHPDHFHVPTLRRILAAAGGRIPVLIPRLFFSDLRDSLRQLGFQDVREMVPGRAFGFKGLTLFSQQFRMNDSLLVIQGDATVINLNDCPVRGSTLQALARRFPGPDYVFAQFSVAQAYPYSYGDTQRDWDKEDLIARFSAYERAFGSRFMIPFASFVRFCHEDNRHMNPHRTTLGQLAQKGIGSLTLLYPGDSIEDGRIARDPGAQERYEEGIASQSFVPRQPARLEDVLHALEAFLATLRARIPAWIRRRVPPARILFNDAPHGLRLDLGTASFHCFPHDPAEPLTTSPREPLAYALSTGTLLEALSHPWGWADLQIGAKFQARVEPGWEAQEYWLWAVPILGLEGYLRWQSLWFLRPRSLGVAWGRRLEILDYLRRLRDGSFMSDVVRKKTDYGRSARAKPVP